MIKVGDPIDGYCKKCRRNVFMTIAATDGREIFSVACRTCQTTQEHKAEVSAETMREQAFKKLQRAATRRRKVSVSRGPEIVSRSRRSDEAEVEPEAATPAPRGRRIVGAAGDASAEPRAESRPAAALSPAPRRRISAVEAPTPSRRRSGAASLPPMPTAMPQRKDEVLPPPAPVPEITAQWREKTANLGPRDGKVYHADRTYDIGDVLLHKRFGMGIVETVIHEHAIMVLFRDGQQVIEMGSAAQ